MNALYFGLGPTVDTSDFDIISINNNIGNYGKLGDLINTDNDYFWSSWGCNSLVIPCCSSSITAMIITDGNTTYEANVQSLVGGRPSRPIAH